MNEQSMEIDFTPKLGNKLEGAGMEIVINAILKHQENFPETPLDLSIGLILSNIGSRFDPVRCTGKEWRGYKKDLISGEGTVTCPNGHDIQVERGLTLGWVMNRE